MRMGLSLGRLWGQSAARSRARRVSARTRRTGLVMLSRRWNVSQVRPNGCVGSRNSTGVLAAAFAVVSASAVQILEREQRAGELPVVVPADTRAAVHLLPHLPEARGHHWPVGLVEIQTALIPLEPEKTKD